MLYLCSIKGDKGIKGAKFVNSGEVEGDPQCSLKYLTTQKQN